MVYCPKCGVKNEEDAKFCTKCGADLYQEKIKDKEDTCFGPRTRERDECFGVPNGGAIVGLVIGIFIILTSISIVFNYDIGRWLGPLFLGLIGVLIIIGISIRMFKK